MGDEAPDLQAVIGRRLRAVRAPAMRQDDVAAGMRRYGFNWTGATVAAIETNRRNVSLEEAIALPLVLRCELTDLVLSPDVPKVALNERGAIHRAALAAVLVGEATQASEQELHPLLRSSLPELDEDVLQAWEQGRFADEALIGVWINEARQQEAERKAARHLGVSTAQVAALALRLWGRSLSEERDARLQETDYRAASEQAVKGHITRELRDEIKTLLPHLDTLSPDYSPDELSGIDPKVRQQMRHISLSKLNEVIDQVIEFKERKEGES